MSLFKAQDITTTAPSAAAPVASAQAFCAKQELTLEAGRKSLQAVLPRLVKDTAIHYQTGGQWSAHQLIGHLLEQIGPAHLTMTTWSMTEDPCRALLMLRQKGLLLSAACLLSERINERTPTIMQLAQHVFDQLRMTKLHAKIILLRNEHWAVSVVSSANLTRNSKTEAGVITESAGLYDFHHNWIKNELRKSK